MDIGKELRVIEVDEPTTAPLAIEAEEVGETVDEPEKTEVTRG